MKKLFFISGTLTVAFGILFITGILDFNHSAGHALVTGNRFYTEDAFDKALEAYGVGLQKEPDNPMLNYNAAQACYRLKAYDKAVELYGKASATVDLYLNRGNSSLRLGDGTEDTNQKLQHYANALDTYKQGILTFPQNVELKYNYEYVLEKLKELQDNMENQQNDSQDNQEGQDQNQQQGGGQENQGDSQQDQQGEQQDEENPQDNQQGEDENNPEEEQETGQQNSEDQQSEGQDNQQNPEEQQSEASGQDEQQQPETSPTSGDEENQAGSSADESVQHSSEIERILQMLEKQEEQALKNNQRIRDSGKEDEHDW